MKTHLASCFTVYSYARHCFSKTAIIRTTIIIQLFCRNIRIQFETKIKVCFYHVGMTVFIYIDNYEGCPKSNAQVAITRKRIIEDDTSDYRPSTASLYYQCMLGTCQRRESAWILCPVLVEHPNVSGHFSSQLFQHRKTHTPKGFLQLGEDIKIRCLRSKL